MRNQPRYTPGVLTLYFTTIQNQSCPGSSFNYLGPVYNIATHLIVNLFPIHVYNSEALKFAIQWWQGKPTTMNYWALHKRKILVMHTKKKVLHALKHWWIVIMIKSIDLPGSWRWDILLVVVSPSRYNISNDKREILQHTTQSKEKIQIKIQLTT